MAGYLALKTMEGNNGSAMQGSGVTAGGETEDYYRQEMLVAVQTGDEDKLRVALEYLKKNYPTAIDTPFPDCTIPGATALHIATQNSSIDFVILLLEAGANTNIRVQKGKKYTPIHYAANLGNPLIMRALLNKGADPNSKEEEMGRSPLHLLANAWKKDEENNYKECLDALLSRNKIRVDSPDTKKATPLFLAATKNWEYMAKRLIEKGASLTYKVGRKSTEDLVRRNFPGLLETIDLSAIETPQKHYGDELYDALIERDIAQFRNIMNELNDCKDKKLKMSALEEKRGKYTMLQFACEHGLVDFAQELAEGGASVSQMETESEMSALLYAARNGHYAIIEVLLKALKEGRELDKGALKQKDRKQETALHKIVKREYGIDEKDGVDFYRCLELMLNEKYKKFVDIDAQDAFGNTPLHYAVLCDDQSFVRLLLMNGAHLGIRNRFGTLAITRIQASVLEEVLDDSIKSNKNPTDKDFQIILHYSLLAPTNTAWRPETECLRFLSCSSKHRRLLLHPIFDTFLSLKWQRIQQYYFFNILAYTLFVLFLTIYILLFHGSYTPDISTSTAVNATNKISDSTSTQSLAGKYTLQAVISLFLIYITVREGVQLIVSWRRYVARLENWLEISIVVLSIALFLPIGSASQQSISAWLILFSWIEFVLLLGRHPYLSVYITMFTTVAFNFLKFIIMFSFMIVAFSISFYLIFQVDDNFVTYPGALLKTLAMTTGEIEYTDLPLATFPVSSHFFFIVFVFLIVLVLMNLLNGLAVSDIQQIREEAEIVSYVSRVELISYIESVFLGSPLKRVMPGPLRCCEGNEDAEDSENRTNACTSPHNPIMRLLNWLGHRILMFYSCLSQTEPIIKLYPNRETMRWEVCKCHKFSLKESQIEAAKDIVLEKEHATSHHRFSGIELRMEEIMKELKSLTQKVNQHVLCPSPQ